MTEFATVNFGFLQPSHETYNLSRREEDSGSSFASKTTQNEPPPPLPIVICPTEIDSINITLEKNQQCACKDCGKLFNSVWYLKQHAVKHSNDRPFKCKYCFKTYKFRSNLYQHKCPDRQKQLTHGNRRRGGLTLSPASRRLDSSQLLKSRVDTNTNSEEIVTYQLSLSDTEDNDLPITYGLVIHKLEEVSRKNEVTQQAQQPNSEGDDPVVAQKRRADCVRDQPLPQEEIDAYIARNKSKLHTCRKCRLTFPSEASLMRHSGAHSREDMFPYKCGCCRQAFECDQGLRRHSQVHADVGPRRCEECFGIFRSPLALRRHLDQCRQCCIAPVQNEIMVSVHSPCDAFSFIPSESEGLRLLSDEARRNRIGCYDELSQECHNAQFRSSLPLDVDPFYMFTSSKTYKEDDEDSGFRSRVNSVTQSSSPASSCALSTESVDSHSEVMVLDQPTVNNYFNLPNPVPLIVLLECGVLLVVVFVALPVNLSSSPFLDIFKIFFVVAFSLESKQFNLNYLSYEMVTAGHQSC
ncbi:Zinc finger C2H2 type [Trichostrongylus colubriformis]|uniref:Zinc finger C2H2 type n=1 Tax=Trichostrongylus colubriformis TaxID=6319 RepID=A0AAN8J1A8_TRICO